MTLTRIPPAKAIEMFVSGAETRGNSLAEEKENVCRCRVRCVRTLRFQILFFQ